MKRKLFLAVCCIAVYVGACMAQDVIVTRDARKIECWVFEVGRDEVKYKRFDNPDGPTYTLEKCLIASIAYQNGKAETFEKCKDLEPEPALTPEPTQKPASDTMLNTTPNTVSAAGPLSRMKQDNPALYQRYMSARKTESTGATLLIVGGGLIVGGYLLVDDTSVGAISIYTGMLVMGISIPIGLTGTIRKGKALREYRPSRQYSQSSPRIQLNLHGNGMGLAYVF